MNVDFLSGPHKHHVILEYVKTSTNFGYSEYSGMMKTTSAEAVDCNSIVSMSIAIKLDQTVYLCVERHIKYTKKIKLNAKRNIVKFNSIQFI